MKGQLYTLEVGISIMMILSMVVFLFLNPPYSPEYSTVNYKIRVYDSLKVMEQNGDLRRYANDNNITAINESISQDIPSFLNRAVVIFNDSTNLTSKPSLNEINDSIIVSYFLAGDFDNYDPKDIRIYIWGYKEVYTTTSTTTTTVVTCSGTNTCNCAQYQDWDTCQALGAGSPPCEPAICCDWDGSSCTAKRCIDISEIYCSQCTGCS